VLSTSAKRAGKIPQKPAKAETTTIREQFVVPAIRSRGSLRLSSLVYGTAKRRSMHSNSAIVAQRPFRPDVQHGRGNRQTERHLHVAGVALADVDQTARHQSVAFEDSEALSEGSNLDQGWRWRSKRSCQRMLQFFGRGGANALHAIALGQREEVDAGYVKRRHAVDFQHLRELAQRTIGSVLQDQENYRDLVA
jgi:hypothetical protein